MNIFDGNTHIEKDRVSIRLKELNKWHNGGDEGTISHYATVQDIVLGMRKHDIHRSLVMPNTVTADKAEGSKASEMVAHEIKGRKGIDGVAVVHPHSANPVYDLEDAVQEHGLRVLMLSPDKQGFDLSDESLWMLFERVEEMGIPVMIYTQWSKESEEYLNSSDLYDLGSSFHIDLILAHMGVGSDLAPLSDLADLRNIFFETSHIQPKDILHAIDMFGAKRLIFGSDFSYNLYPKYELEKIQDLEIDQKEKEKIMGRNLEKLVK